VHNRHPHFYSATKLSQASYDFISHSPITRHGRDPQPSRLMPVSADERCVGAIIFAATRNTVHVHRRLQRTDILSYHRRRRQQMRSWAHRHAFVDASANVRMYAQQSVDEYVSATRLCEFTDAFTENSLSAHLCCAVCAVSYYSPR